MKKVLGRCSGKGGSVVFVIIGVFVALLIILASFMKSTTSRTYTTKKLNETLMAREFSNSLALLACHYIKNVELKDSGSKIREALSTPYDKMADASEDITDKLKNCIKGKVKSGSDDMIALLEQNSGLKDLKWNLKWIINQKTFSALTIGEKKPYPREKDGVLGVYITVTHTPPGSKSKITEDYYYVSQITVVANILPVLSKFTLYVADAMAGDEEYRFNLAKTDSSGNMKTGSTYRPWVLNHGQNSSETPDKYKDLVTSDRGLVYLGGGTEDKPLILGLARGWSDNSNGEYGEDFHFFRNVNTSEGYWKTVKLYSKNDGLMTSHIGLCDDESDANLKLWQEQLGKAYKIKSKSNSILKLYGTDSAKSPTLVLGNVMSMYAEVNMYKGEGYFNLLSHFDFEEDFLSAMGYDPPFEAGDILSFSNAYTRENGGTALDFNTYGEEFSSKLATTHYNESYLYVLTGNKVDYPYERSAVSQSDKLAGLAGHKPSSFGDDIFNEVPEGYNNIYSEKTLGDMSNFLDVDLLSINGDSDSKNNKRIAYFAEISKAGNNLEEYFKSKGLLTNGELDLNGWVLVKSSSSQEIDIEKCKVVSNSGIIVDGGDVAIKGDITCDSKSHFTIIALNGSINVESGVSRVDASLIAGGSEGQVKLLGGASAPKLTIRGNIAMNTIAKSGFESAMSRGVTLNYNEKLSALPEQDDSNKDRSELPLLMFSFKINPKMFD